MVDVLWTHKRSDRRFSAVPLEEILRIVGVAPGEMGTESLSEGERSAWKIDVIAPASDGFQAVFRVAEFYRRMRRTEAYVALVENGRPLDEKTGPLRLVVPTDFEASRSVRNLLRLTVVDLRRIVRSQ